MAVRLSPPRTRAEAIDQKRRNRLEGQARIGQPLRQQRRLPRIHHGLPAA
jgi:hypothetical protein